MGTKRVIELVESHGLTNVENISSYIKKCRGKQLDRLEHELREAVGDVSDTREVISGPSYSYLASASFRGESGCEEPKCRALGVEPLARFSLLYADKIVLPMRLSAGGDRSWLEGTFRVLAELRPLLDAGIVIPTETESCLCKECYGNYAVPILDNSHAIADSAAEQTKVTFEYALRRPRRTKANQLVFRIDWPEEYSPRPAPYLSVSESELHPVLGEFLKGRNEETVIPVNVVQESDLLANFFLPVALDFMIQSFLGASAGCVYLSNSAREVRQIEKLGGADADSTRNEILAAMSHEIPLFANIRLETLLKVRRSDGDAFEAYRAALHSAANEAVQKGITPVQSRQIYFDVIHPKLSALERKYQVLRSRSKTNLIYSYGVPIATLAIGAICGPTHGLGGLLEIAGGLELVKNVAKQLQPLQNADSSLDPVRSDPMYFLLKMKRAHAKDCGE